MAQINILFSDNHLLVVNKPTGLATMGTALGQASLHRSASAYIKSTCNKPGNVYLGVVMRLDACAAGVVVFARTSKAAARLSAQFRDRSVEKRYLAVVERAPATAASELVDWIIKDENRQSMVVVTNSTAGAQEARMSYQVEERLADATLLSVRLQTGRKHQIRVQLSHLGCPILGDQKYGARQSFSAGGIGLLAWRLTLEHPITRVPMEFVAPLPANWRSLGLKSLYGTA